MCGDGEWGSMGKRQLCTYMCEVMSGRNIRVTAQFAIS